MTEILTWRKQPILRINDEKIKVQFGLKKAKLILANIKEIEKFVADYAGIAKNEPAG